jgi:hypothetical protein
VAVVAEGIHPRADKKQALLSVMNALRGTTAPLVMEFIAHYERIISNVLASSELIAPSSSLAWASRVIIHRSASLIHHNILKRADWYGWNRFAG